MKSLEVLTLISVESLVLSSKCDFLKFKCPTGQTGSELVSTISLSSLEN